MIERQNNWKVKDKMAIVRGMFIAINAYIKKLEGSPVAQSLSI